MNDPEPRWAPTSPNVALVPGVLLVLGGLSVVTDGGPPLLGWAMFAIGQALLLSGAVANGVSWGMALHEENKRGRPRPR